MLVDRAYILPQFVWFQISMSTLKYGKADNMDELG